MTHCLNVPGSQVSVASVPASSTVSVNPSVSRPELPEVSGQAVSPLVVSCFFSLLVAIPFIEAIKSLIREIKK